tara:strand:- start:994 stop:1440 length:447 start_codon:yes stop_codon:yes gene_type:complete
MFKIHLTSFVISLFLSTSVFAGTGHKMVEGDLELPIDDVKVVQEGRDWYAQRCAFCHGGGGKGGKGPCLTCGKFSYSGNTNTDIFTTISVGIPRNRGGSMGAFGTSMTPDTIIAVVTFLRAEETRRIKEGEIEDPYKFKQEKLKFPGE